MYNQNDHAFPSRAALAASALYRYGAPIARGAYNFMTYRPSYKQVAAGYGAYRLGRGIYGAFKGALAPPYEHQRSHWGRGGRRMKFKFKRRGFKPKYKKYKKKKFYRKY